MKALNKLKELIKEEQKRKYPNLPEHCHAINTFGTAKPEKREKKRIQKFCDLMGHNVVIIENRGQRIDNTKIVTDYLGNKKQIGSVDWIGSGMKKGIADLQGSIKGRAVAIELKRKYKRGKDRLSAAQIEFKGRQEGDGGIYVVVSSFEDFYEWYKGYTK
jgi:hypothetical protein